MLQNNRWSYNKVVYQAQRDKRKYDLLKINRFKLGRKLITIYNTVIQSLETLFFSRSFSFLVKCGLHFPLLSISLYLFISFSILLYNLNRERIGGGGARY
jgi:hypothetical protein